jgi:hypothetical protein
VIRKFTAFIYDLTWPIRFRMYRRAWTKFLAAKYPEEGEDIVRGAAGALAQSGYPLVEDEAHLEKLTVLGGS